MLQVRVVLLAACLLTGAAMMADCEVAQNVWFKIPQGTKELPVRIKRQAFEAAQNEGAQCPACIYAGSICQTPVTWDPYRRTLQLYTGSALLTNRTAEALPTATYTIDSDGNRVPLRGPSSYVQFEDDVSVDVEALAAYGDVDVLRTETVCAPNPQPTCSARAEVYYSVYALFREACATPPPPPTITAVKTTPTKAKVIVDYQFPATAAYRQILINTPEWIDAQGRTRPGAVLAELRDAQLQSAGPHTLSVDVPNGASKYRVNVITHYIDQVNDCDVKDFGVTEVAPAAGALSLVEGNMTTATVDPLPPIFGGGVVRRYDSAYGEDGFFGRGWTSIFDQQMNWDWDTASVRFDTLDGGYIFSSRVEPFRLDQVFPEDDPLPAKAVWHRDLPQFSLRLGGSAVESLYDELFGRFIGMRNIETGQAMSIAPDGTASGFIVTDSHSGTTWTVAVDDYLIRSITTTSGLTWTYQYDADRNLIRVAGPGNATWQTYEYQGGLLTAVRDAAGKLIQSRTYDALGRVKTSVTPVETITNIEYDVSGQLSASPVTIATVDPANLTTVSRVTLATGRATNVTYAPRGATFKRIDADGLCRTAGTLSSVKTYDPKGRPLSQQLSDGYVQVNTYTGSHITKRQVGLRLSDCDPTTSDTLCKIPAAEFEEASLLPSPAARTIEYEYNDTTWRDKPTAVITDSVLQHGGKVREELTYDAATGQTLVRRVKGWTGDPKVEQERTVTTVLYDGTEEGAFDPGITGLAGPQPRLPKTVDGARTDVADVTTFVYYPISDTVPAGARGKVAAVKNALGQVVKFEDYDLFGNARRITDANGVITERTTDAIGRVLTSTLKAKPGCDSSLDPLCAVDLVTTFVYAGLGPLLREERPDGSVTLFTYDDRGRLSTASRGPDETHLKEQAEFAYDPVSGKASTLRHLEQSGGWAERRTESYAYTADGYLQKVIHADGSFLEYEYDRAGRVAAVKDENSSAPNKRTAYDASGRVARVDERLGVSTVSAIYTYDVHGNLATATDPNGNVTTYAYDDFGARLKEISPASGTTTYGYDLAGNVVSTTDANGAQTIRTYDAEGRVLTSASARPGFATESLAWSYDNGAFGIGRVGEITEPTGTTSYAYDRRGAVQRESKTVETTTYTTTFQYDKQGNPVRVAYPSGAILNYGYDHAGRPVSAAWNGTPLVNTATYAPFGPLTSIAYGNGTTKTVVYDKSYGIEENKLTGPQGVIASYDYDRDHVGNVTQIRDAQDGGFTRDFVYDALHRLTSVTTGAKLWATATYEYDPAGNMLRSTTGATQRVFGYGVPALRPVTVTENGVTRNIAYDAAGNETSVGADGAVYTARSLRGSTSPFSYAYDGRGIRTVTTPLMTVTGISLSPASTTGGTTVNGTVTLSAPVINDTPITLNSSNATVAAVARTVTIPAGSSTGNFTVTTTTVSEQKEVVVSGAWLGRSVSTTLIVAPQASLTLTVSPATVTGGATPTGTLVLGQPRALAFEVALQSNHSSVGVPATVTIPAGQTNVTFPITTVPVAAPVIATITVTGGAATAERTLTVVPPVLDVVAVDQTSVFGGHPTDAIVSLTGPAPAGGAVVTLRSDVPALRVPASVTVAASSAAAPFVVTTVPVDSLVTATITATRNGVDRQVGVTVKPAALDGLTIDPASVTGGDALTATVALNAPAGPSGTTVELSSSNTAVLASPGPITVAAGDTTADALMGTAAVDENVVVVLTATRGQETRASSVTVKPPAVSLALVDTAPNPRPGYEDFIFEVRLGVRGGEGSSTVMLSVWGANWIVPSSVVVPYTPGSARFTATHTNVNDGSSAVITARLLTGETAEWRFPPELIGDLHLPDRSSRMPNTRCASLALAPCLATISSATVLPPEPPASRYSLYNADLHLIAETAISSATPKPLQYEYVWFGNMPLAQIDVPSGTITWTFTDHLAAPIVQSDSGANVVWRAEYEPFGRIHTVRVGEGRHQPLRFPGQDAEQFDDLPNGNTDRSYNIARWYRPGWGRFLSADPTWKSADVGSPQSWNRYAYVRNNPINRIDPDGRVDGNGMGEPLEWNCGGCSRAEQLKQSNRIAAGTTGLAAIALYFILTKGEGWFAPDANESTTAPEASQGIRYTQDGETFYRYESDNPDYSRVTPGGGLQPGTFVAPSSDGIVPEDDRPDTYNLPDPNIPRTRIYEVRPPEGTPVIGPRPVEGGSGNEVIFPNGVPPGSVTPKPVPKRKP